MKFPFLKTKEGKWSTTNIVALLMFLIGIAQIWLPFVPEQYRVLEVPFAATIMLIVRTWFSSGKPIQTL